MRRARIRRGEQRRGLASGGRTLGGADRRRHEMAGSTLLEVTIALLLLAGTTLGALGAQLAIGRAAREAAAREAALRLAGSRAETARDGSAAMIDWPRAARHLPGARIEMDAAPPLARVQVQWQGASSSSSSSAVRTVRTASAMRAAPVAHRAPAGSYSSAPSGPSGPPVPPASTVRSIALTFSSGADR
ncbi:MAG: hypothetical protein GAK40_01399 [Burkholderia plantarii]|nr:MAG: hypothetical protein GAK40_01399 [Burkholderia plantarii]